jgi:branched-chain amino acid transport system substrate-binding protein
MFPGREAVMVLKKLLISLVSGSSLRTDNRQLTTLFLALALTLSLSAAAAAATIKIGEVDPLTGGVSQFGIGCHQGFVLAFEQINAEGGILGQKVELVTEDDQSKPGQSATAVRKLITQDKVVAILGDATSSATLEAAPIAQSDKIPMITPTATNPRITEAGDFIFRVCFLDEFQGRVLARFAREKLKAEKVFTLTDVKQDYSVDLLKFFKEEFTKLGGRIVGEQSYATGDTDFRAQLTPIRAVKPDAVYVPGYYQEVALIVRQGRQIGLTMPFIGCDGWANQALLAIGGKAMEGCFFTNHFSPNDQSPIVQGFVTKYREKYGVLPDTFSALGYDAARLLSDAIQRAGSSNSQAVRDALSKTAGFQGVTGQISLDANRNASKPGLVVTVKEGKFEIAEKIDPQ